MIDGSWYSIAIELIYREIGFFLTNWVTFCTVAQPNRVSTTSTNDDGCGRCGNSRIYKYKMNVSRSSFDDILEYLLNVQGFSLTKGYLPKDYYIYLF